MEQFSKRDRAVAAAVVSVFETSSPRPKYDVLTILNDGPGNIPQVTFGSHQMTDGSNSLDRCVERIISLSAPTIHASSVHIDILQDRLPLLRANTTSSIIKLARDKEFHAALRASGKTDPGKLAQRQVYDELYIQPAVNACAGSGFTHALSLATVLDGMTQGGWRYVRDLISSSRTEFEWITGYLWRRRNWLRSHPKGILKATAVRPESLLRLAFNIEDVANIQKLITGGDMDAIDTVAKDGNWGLVTPFRLAMYGKRGVVTIEEPDLELC